MLPDPAQFTHGAATGRQSRELAEACCEIVRITAPNVAAARALRDIRAQFSAAGFAHVPLVADIHFLPAAAMEAVEHVEKIRVNPGNYADKKKFAVVDYSDAEYEREIQRLHDSFSPLVKRCRELGRCLRIGTNHGSLSDRIMNRYGDSPLGMVESALEFVRICESHGFHDIVLSMKSSNPKVVIQAYRLPDARAEGAPVNTASPEFLAVNPMGQIPALSDGDLVLTESLAITLHIARTRGGDLGPRDAAETALMEQWALFAASAIETPALEINYAIGNGSAETPEGQAVIAVAAFAESMMVVAAPEPSTFMALVIRTCVSRYVPGQTLTVSPGFAAFIPD